MNDTRDFHPSFYPISPNSPNAPKSMGAFQTFLTVLSTGLAIAWIGQIGYNVYILFNPALSFKNIPPGSTFYHNGWNEKTSFHLDFYVTTPHQKLIISGQKKTNPILTQSGVRFGDSFEKVINITLPKETLNNGSLQLHCLMYKAGAPLDSSSPAFRKTNVRYFSKLLTKYLPVIRNETRNLLSDQASKIVPDNDLDPPKILSHWKPSLNVQVVNDRTSYPWGYFPGDYFNFLDIDESEKEYSPILYLNDVHLRREHFIPINAEELAAKQPSGPIQLPLTIKFQTIPLGWFRLILQMEQGFENMRHSILGHSEKEIDNVRQMFFETSPYLLAATLIASVLHLLFDFLAFKSDISHWKGKKTMEGVSRSSVLMTMFSSVVVMFYLLDRKEETSIIVSGGAIFAALVEIWKFFKVFKLQITWENVLYCFPCPHFRFPQDKSQITQEEEATQNLDSKAIRYLMYGLIPFSILYAIYSLVYMEHKGYYSWALDSLVSLVYVIGFVNMTPQLFINYHLKSVEAMPITAFLFRTVNTFVDDLFAFVITMPTMTRLGAFRDDIVFFVLLYQWYIYPKRKTAEKESEPKELSSKEKKNK